MATIDSPNTSTPALLRDDMPPQSRLQRLRRRLWQDDERLIQELQPHLSEPLTRKLELWGFFGFGFGYFSYVNVCASLLLPLLIQGVARDASYLESQPSTRCPADDADIPPGDRCLVPFGWIHVTPTSYVLLVNVVTVWCTIFTTLGISALADHGRMSNRLALTFGIANALVTCLFFIGAVASSVWWICGFFFVIAGIFNGITLNFYDAMIPNLTRFHPSVIQATVEYGAISPQTIQAKVKMQTFLSGGASAAGYAGGLFLTIVVALILLFTDASLQVVGFCTILVGAHIIFWLCFFAKNSVQRTSPPLPPGANWATFGYKRIGKTISKARRLGTLFYFLCTWLVLGDGLSATSNMAILIAQDQLKLDNTSLIAAALIQFVFAGGGMAFWIWMQNSKGLSPLKTVILNAFLFGLIPVYCLFGLIDSSPIGLKYEWELYMLACFFGLFMGAIYSSNRVVYAQFIPTGHENEFFALYEMSSVSSSWIAPLVCSAIVERAGVRHTWWFLASQFFIPVGLLLFVNVDKGRAEGIAFRENEIENLDPQTKPHHSSSV
ncbi:Autophagy protein 22 [Lunasporangiospora selenospora]|uniref:Autophagy-related protein n=1 Tax=Lunasporangiospora selenospora TaxID=979761 RepID=A0A9P6G2I2_9FUNG|nr:Autophagy protein 22 [Lunasporangiospora selenospora]